MEFLGDLNLKTAVGSQKSAPGLGATGKIKKCLITTEGKKKAEGMKAHQDWYILCKIGMFIRLNYCFSSAVRNEEGIE